MDINEKIKEVALSFVGQKEISGNLGFKDKEFESAMRDVGFETGHAWCSYFVELVWTKSYRELGDIPAALELPVLFNASAVSTYRSFRKSPNFTVSRTPAIGSLAVWQKYVGGKPDWRGHIGVVVAFDDNSFECVEGNTNTKGGREGIEVGHHKGTKARPYNFTVKNGLRLLGFVHPRSLFGPKGKQTIVV